MRRRAWPLVPVAGLLLALVPTLSADAATPGNWVQLRPATSPPSPFSFTPIPNAPPPPRLNLLAFDAQRQQVLLFTIQQTWTFDGSIWQERHPAASPSTNAVAASMTYDGTTGNVLLLQSERDNLDHTYLWDGSTWTEQHPAGEPPAFGGVAYDGSRNQVVAQVWVDATRSMQTWTWDGTTWTQQHPASEPPGLGFLADDPATHSVVQVGSSANPFDTWTWDGTTWTQQRPAVSPGPNCAPNPASFDGTQVVMLTASCGTWAWDGATWVQLNPAATPPSPRSDFGLAFDGTRVILFGGIQHVSPTQDRDLNDTWAWVSSAVRSRPYTGGHDAVGVTQGSTAAYFAAGSTALNFFTYLTVLNPGPAQSLTVRYFTDRGGVITRQHQLAAGSRTTIFVNADAGPGKHLGAHLSAPDPFLAERPVYFSAYGVIDGGYDVVGASSLSTTYYFAEGYTGPGFQEELALLNPGTTDATAQVTYFFNSGRAPRVVPHRVPARSQLIVAVNDPDEAGGGQEVSIKVVSDQPIAAERPMYFTYFGETGGSDVMGATGLLTDLNLAEGHVGQSFDEYLTILNPAAAQAATVTYYRTGQSPLVTTVSLAANSRTTVHVNQVLAAGTDSSVHIHAGLPILVERPMYFTYQGRTGGHDAMAVGDAAIAQTQLFGEGFVSPGFAQYVTIMNRNPEPAAVHLAYHVVGGGEVDRDIQVPANSRWTEFVNRDLAPYTENSLVLTSNMPVLAERPMYFSY